MITDPIADMLTRIRNGYLAHKVEVEAPYSSFKEEIANILVKLGYLETVSKSAETQQKPALKIVLKYKNGVPAVSNIDRLSKPSLRVYKRSHQLPVVLNGMGSAIVSTSQGLMTAREAKKKKLGGELILRVY